VKEPIISKSDNIEVDDNLFFWMRDIRRHIHRHPELGFEEYKTSQLITEKLRELGINFRSGLAKTGIVAEIGSQKGHFVALRADMDALPLKEETGLSFSSQEKEIMHACGHDGHVAMLLGAAFLLKRIEDRLKLPVRLIFQPAEEAGAGAKAMIDAGALEDVTIIFAGHIDPNFHVGEIGYKPGLLNAYADGFEIYLTGEGGHGARPHEGKDALVAAAHLILSLQTLSSRCIDPLSPHVISVGQMQIGDAPNCIAHHGVIKGTVRSTDSKVRDDIFLGIKRCCDSISEMMDIKVELKWIQSYPPVINDEFALSIAKEAAKKTVGQEGLRLIALPSLGGEDFAYYLERVRGAMLRFGAGFSNKKQYPLHNPKFDFNEGVFRVGASFLAQVAVLSGDMLTQGYN